MTLIELAGRVERAEADSGGLMILAYYACFGMPNTEAEHRPFDRFHAMLNAGAYESAALTLVPDGLAWSGEFSDYNYANCWPDTSDYDGRPLGEGRGATPALAIVAAALKARAAE